MNKYYKYIIFIVLVGIISCYDPTEDIPTVCFTLSRDTLQVGDTLYLYDCSDCRGITVQWGDSVKSYTDSYTYDNGQSGNHTFQHIYGDTGRFVIRVSVYKTVQRGLDWGATFRYAEGYDTILVQ